MRFFFVYKGRTTPSGGHKQIRHTVSLLRSQGADAWLLGDGPIGDDHLYDSDAPFAGFDFAHANQNMSADDVLVFPEALLDSYLKQSRGWNVRRAVFNQNGFYSLVFSPWRSYASQGVEFVIVNAPYVRNLSCRALGMSPGRVFLVPYVVARPPFTEAGMPYDERPLAVAYMPRKLAEVVAAVRKTIEAERPDVQWVEIDKIPEAEVARRLKSVRIFLSSQDREGFGLPAVEAMLSGALVTGFRGTDPFPHPYATSENGLWASDGSVEEATSRLRDALMLASNPSDPKLRGMLAKARATGEGFSESATRAALAHVVDRVQRRAYDATVDDVDPLTADEWKMVRHLRWDARISQVRRLLGR